MASTVEEVNEAVIGDTEPDDRFSTRGIVADQSPSPVHLARRNVLVAEALLGGLGFASCADGAGSQSTDWTSSAMALDDGDWLLPSRQDASGPALLAGVQSRPVGFWVATTPTSNSLSDPAVSLKVSV